MLQYRLGQRLDGNLPDMLTRQANDPSCLVNVKNSKSANDPTNGERARMGLLFADWIAHNKAKIPRELPYATRQEIGRQFQLYLQRQTQHKVNLDRFTTPMVQVLDGMYHPLGAMFFYDSGLIGRYHPQSRL